MFLSMFFKCLVCGRRWGLHGPRRRRRCLDAPLPFALSEAGRQRVRLAADGTPLAGSEIVVVKFAEWSAVYLNGVKYEEGRTIPFLEEILALNQPFSLRQDVGNDTWLAQVAMENWGDCLPDELEDVKVVRLGVTLGTVQSS